jgi:SAM-dependent methyltransferase
MYNSLKNTAKTLLPKSLLFRMEPFLRGLVLFRYRGKKFKCNICDTRLRTFISLKKGDLLCPACGSRSRTRKLLQLLNDESLLQGNILDFSPPRGFYRKLKRNKAINYYPTDFENEFIAHYKYNITDIPVEEDYFDLILCYHILEHIPDDNKAIAELFRVLKPNGCCFIQTPFKKGDIYEDPEIISPNERLIAFGQEDHVRIYSVNGLKNRLEKARFKVEVISFTEKEENFHGFKSEIVLKVRK